MDIVIWVRTAEYLQDVAPEATILNTTIFSFGPVFSAVSLKFFYSQIILQDEAVRGERAGLLQ